MHDAGLLKTIKYFGSQEEVARVLEVSQQLVSYWLNCSRKIPYELALRIAFYTRGLVRIGELTDKVPEITMYLNHLIFSQVAAIFFLPIVEVIKEDSFYARNKNDSEIMDVPTPKESALPIWLDEKDRLITGEKRLEAQRVLKRKTISARCLKIEDVLEEKNHSAMEFLMRDFPITERIAIGLFIRERVGSRQGKRMDLELRVISPKVPAGKKMSDLIAKICGIGSDSTYRQAKKVLLLGVSELREAMDAKIISINKANKVAQLSLQEQSRELAKIYAKKQLKEQKNQKKEEK